MLTFADCADPAGQFEPVAGRRPAAGPSDRGREDPLLAVQPPPADDLHASRDLRLQVDRYVRVIV